MDIFPPGAGRVGFILQEVVFQDLAGERAAEIERKPHPAVLPSFFLGMSQILLQLGDDPSGGLPGFHPPQNVFVVIGLFDGDGKVHILFIPQNNGLKFVLCPCRGIAAGEGQGFGKGIGGGVANLQGPQDFGQRRGAFEKWGWGVDRQAWRILQIFYMLFIFP